jgi:hypothetical protein
VGSDYPRSGILLPGAIWSPLFFLAAKSLEQSRNDGQARLQKTAPVRAPAAAPRRRMPAQPSPGGLLRPELNWLGLGRRLPSEQPHVRGLGFPISSGRLAILDFVTLNERSDALNCAEVTKNVRAARVGRDKPKPANLIPPLNFAVIHSKNLQLGLIRFQVRHVANLTLRQLRRTPQLTGASQHNRADSFRTP